MLRLHHEPTKDIIQPVVFLAASLENQAEMQLTRGRLRPRGLNEYILAIMSP